MTRLGSIEFDECILDALRDNELVIFAGAGVSMGAPSGLASFEKLASDIAFGTGQIVSAPLDRFLGQLKHANVAVHERAAKFLSPEGSAPNLLHHDLVRLFRSNEHIRLVTTNFDRHFETAAETLFGSIPSVYEAPALPLGREFRGIVHVHGCLSQPNNMVLTDADFGRAYLTKGWARRFLVDVFRRYTVLFVGYSHSDVVMNYLARALPVDSVAGRFALTEEDGSWNLLGIKPIHFNKCTGSSPYSELNEGIARLAGRVARGALDWQTRIAEICGRIPPVDQESIGEVEQALREVHTTRFLTNIARKPEWPKWLSNHKHLNKLFDTGNLNERDNILAGWLAENFAIEHPEVMFELIASHGLRLNMALWWSIGRELGLNNEKMLEESALKRWITILLACMPNHVDHHVLLWLAERCARAEDVDLTLKVFLTMSEHRLLIKPGLIFHESDDGGRPTRLDADCPLRSDHWALNEVWTKHLKQHIALLVQPLLSGAIRRFEEIFQDLSAWGKASAEWDPISYGRSAIEPHEQDQYQEAIDVLIDATRDVLEWLSVNNPKQLNTWIDRLVISDALVLRRLSLHVVAAHPQMSSNERLKWLLQHIDLHAVAEHHEIYRFVAINYGVSSVDLQRAVVDSILAHKVLDPWENWSVEKLTAYSHFNWLSWLCRAKSDCPFVNAALEHIKLAYPEWDESEHPDFTHFGGSASWVGDQSPWTADQLLADEPPMQLEKLLAFSGKRFEGPDRNGLIAEVKEACKVDTKWAFSLADALVNRSLWSSDLWPAIFRGLQETQLTVDLWRKTLSVAATPELHGPHGYDIANLIYAIVRDGGVPFALDLLDQANGVALPVWRALESNNSDENVKDWLSLAINRPAGIIAEFWINGLSLSSHGKTDEKVLPETYKKLFTMIVDDPTSKGGLGRSVIASQVAFLFSLDEDWTRLQVVSLFSDDDNNKFCQAWDGFLVWGRLYPALVDVLLPAFLIAIARIGNDAPDRRQRFIEFYAAVALFHVEDPTNQFLPMLFKFGSMEDRARFAGQVGYLLRQMRPDVQQRLCASWLLRYWRERQQAVPAALEEVEIQYMLDWLPCLGESFPDAVTLAVRSPAIHIEHSRLLYDLRESDLVIRYPISTAELLIYIASCVVGYNASSVMAVVTRLPVVPTDLQLRLKEALARAGLG